MCGHVLTNLPLQSFYSIFKNRNSTKLNPQAKVKVEKGQADLKATYDPYDGPFRDSTKITGKRLWTDSVRSEITTASQATRVAEGLPTQDNLQLFNTELANRWSDMDEGEREIWNEKAKEKELQRANAEAEMSWKDPKIYEYVLNESMFALANNVFALATKRWHILLLHSI